jgi:hypothetical protein
VNTMEVSHSSASLRALLIGLLCVATCWISATFLSCSGDEQTVEPIPNSLSGEVVDADGGKPLPKVNITVGSDTTRTNGQGQYVITGLNKTTYLLEATLSGYDDYSADVSVDGLTEYSFSMQLKHTGPE